MRGVDLREHGKGDVERKGREGTEGAYVFFLEKIKDRPHHVSINIGSDELGKVIFPP